MLVVLDGWGWREDKADNAVRQARTPNFDRLWANCPRAFLHTSGRDVGLPESMQRAMAKQAEAERERRAKIIAAEGELQASVKLGEAATVMATAPGALQLRQLQTMVEISAEKNSTIIFPIPIELLEAFQAISKMTGQQPR